MADGGTGKIEIEEQRMVNIAPLNNWSKKCDEELTNVQINNFMSSRCDMGSER